MEGRSFAGQLMKRQRSQFYQLLSFSWMTSPKTWELAAVQVFFFFHGSEWILFCIFRNCCRPHLASRVRDVASFHNSQHSCLRRGLGIEIFFFLRDIIPSRSKLFSDFSFSFCKIRDWFKLISPSFVHQIYRYGVVFSMCRCIQSSAWLLI